VEIKYVWLKRLEKSIDRVARLKLLLSSLSLTKHPILILSSLFLSHPQPKGESLGLGKFAYNIYMAGL